MDPLLKWDIHIDTVSKTVRKQIYVIRNLANQVSQKKKKKFHAPPISPCVFQLCPMPYWCYVFHHCKKNILFCLFTKKSSTGKSEV